MIKNINLQEVVKIRNLKDELNGILNNSIGQMMGKKFIDELNSKLTELFNFFNLEDIQFRIISDESYSSIIIDPIREIDRYAIYGILNS